MWSSADVNNFFHWSFTSSGFLLDLDLRAKFIIYFHWSEISFGISSGISSIDLGIWRDTEGSDSDVDSFISFLAWTFLRADDIKFLHWSDNGIFLSLSSLLSFEITFSFLFFVTFVVIVLVTIVFFKYDFLPVIGSTTTSICWVVIGADSLEIISDFCSGSSALLSLTSKNSLCPGFLVLVVTVFLVVITFLILFFFFPVFGSLIISTCLVSSGNEDSAIICDSLSNGAEDCWEIFSTGLSAILWLGISIKSSEIIDDSVGIIIETSGAIIDGSNTMDGSKVIEGSYIIECSDS